MYLVILVNSILTIETNIIQNIKKFFYFSYYIMYKDANELNVGRSRNGRLWKNSSLVVPWLYSCIMLYVLYYMYLRTTEK